MQAASKARGVRQHTPGHASRSYTFMRLLRPAIPQLQPRSIPRHTPNHARPCLESCSAGSEDQGLQGSSEQRRAGVPSGSRKSRTRLLDVSLLVSVYMLALTPDAWASMTFEPAMLRAPFGLVTWLDFMLVSGLLLFTLRYVNSKQDGTTSRLPFLDALSPPPASSSNSEALGSLTERDVNSFIDLVRTTRKNSKWKPMRNRVLTTAAANNCIIAIKDIRPRVNEAAKQMEESGSLMSTDPVICMLREQLGERSWGALSDEERQEVESAMAKNMVNKVAASQTELLMDILVRGLSQ